MCLLFWLLLFGCVSVSPFVLRLHKQKRYPFDLQQSQTALPNQIAAEKQLHVLIAVLHPPPNSGAVLRKLGRTFTSTISPDVTWTTKVPACNRVTAAVIYWCHIPGILGNVYRRFWLTLGFFFVGGYFPFPLFVPFLSPFPPRTSSFWLRVPSYVFSFFFCSYPANGVARFGFACVPLLGVHCVWHCMVKNALAVLAMSDESILSL